MSGDPCTPARVARQSHSRVRITQRDIAELAGVSQATVSLVLNGGASEVGISTETQGRVLSAAEKVGYMFRGGASLVTQPSTGVLGVYAFAPIFPREVNDFYYPFLVGIEAEAEALGFDLRLYTSAIASRRATAIYDNGVNRLRSADGAVILGLSDRPAELLQLVEEDFPFIHVGRRVVNDRYIPCVAPDYVEATQMIVRYLFDLGHRSIGYLVPDIDNEPTDDRIRGFYNAVDDNPSIKPLLRYHSPTRLMTSDIDDLLERKVTVIVVHHVEDAISVYEMIRTRGLRIPQDCSLVALDEWFSGEWSHDMSLAHIEIPREQMGSVAVRMLVQSLTRGRQGELQRFLPCTFAPGDSCASPSF